MLLALIIATFSVCCLLCLNAKDLGRFLKVIDHPDNASKLHLAPTPSVGGICILVPAIAAILMMAMAGLQAPDKLPIAVGLGAAGIGTVGLTDDQSSISPLSRMLSILIFLAVALVIDPELASANFNLSSARPVSPPPYVYWAVIALASVGLLNAANMADGQNGLLPGMFVIWTACLSFVGDETIAPLVSILLVASTVVFAFNLYGKLFLGSCGSYGVTFAILLLLAAQHARLGISVETVVTYFTIPMLDCIRLLITRLVHRRSPASRDINHLHHHLKKAFGWRNGLTAYLSVVGTASLVATLYPKLALLCALASAAAYFGFVTVYVWELAIFSWTKSANLRSFDETAIGSLLFRTHKPLDVALARVRSSRPSDTSAASGGEYLTNQDAA